MKRVVLPIPSLRKYLSWIFAFSFLLGLPATYSTTLSIFASLRHRAPNVHWPASWWLLVFLLPFVMPIQTSVFGLAWWTVFRQKRSARVWGIAASMIFVLWTVLPLFYSPRYFWTGSLLLLGIGLVGLVAFALPGHPVDPAPPAPTTWSLPGDGTNRWVNSVLQLGILLVGWRVYHWWLGWLGNNQLPSPDFLTGTLDLLVIGFLIVLIHESGHTLVGLLFGMKLRAFIVGPFQWRIRDGKWEFHFEPKQILATSGATGVVPATRDFPRSSQLCMLAAGVLSNTLTGTAALAASLLGMVPAGIRGSLALFGIFSLLVSAMNLIPFRAADTYSDGAHIYQLFSKGPWGDFHRVMSLAGATLVTSLRPRDYDINAIHRAAETIAQTRQGLLLRLFAYSYFLDCGDLYKAAEELVQAGTIYNQSASDAPVDWVTTFVF